MSVWLVGPMLLCSLTSVGPVPSGEDGAPAGVEQVQEAPAPAPTPVLASLPPALEPQRPAGPAPRATRLEAPYPAMGFQLDAGVPDGAGLTLLVRPVPLLRFHAGALYNGIAWGARGGLSLVPLQWAVRPTLTAEVGRLWDGDVRPLVERFGASTGSADALLSRVGYDFANAHLGLEFGSARGFSFVLRAGLTYLRTTAHGVGEFIQEEAGDVRVDMVDPRLSLTFPSIKLGFLFYLG